MQKGPIELILAYVVMFYFGPVNRFLFFSTSAHGLLLGPHSEEEALWTLAPDAGGIACVGCSRPKLTQSSTSPHMRQL